MEKEKKIQREIQMKNNMFYVDGSQLNFLTLKKKAPIPLEARKKDCFGISCINKLRRSLLLLTNEEGQMETSSVLDLFTDLHLTQRLFVNLPTTWATNKADYYQRLLGRFQETRSCTIKFKVLFLFILLEDKRVPNDEQIQAIKEDVEKNHMVQWEDFEDVKWYFFESEEAKGKFRE